MQVILREAKKTDMPLIESFTVGTGWKSMSDSERKTLDREKWSKHMVEVFENLLKREDSKIFVAEDENHGFLGYLFVGESRNMITGQTHGFIYDIYVAEEFRGKGIGNKLVEKAEDYCRERGYLTISLMVSTHNQPAIRLYTRVGFQAEQAFMEKVLNRT